MSISIFFRSFLPESTKKTPMYFGVKMMCGRRDLNPNPLLDTPLKRARMPIPPQPHSLGNEVYYTSFFLLCQALVRKRLANAARFLGMRRLPLFPTIRFGGL